MVVETLGDNRVDAVEAAVTLLTSRVRITRESALGILADTARCQRMSLPRYAASLVAAHDARTAIAARDSSSAAESLRFEPAIALA